MVITIWFNLLETIYTYIRFNKHKTKVAKVRQTDQTRSDQEHQHQAIFTIFNQNDRKNVTGINTQQWWPMNDSINLHYKPMEKRKVGKTKRKMRQPLSQLSPTSEQNATI
jgi:hypothetical protein